MKLSIALAVALLSTTVFAVDEKKEEKLPRIHPTKWP